MFSHGTINVRKGNSIDSRSSLSYFELYLRFWRLLFVFITVQLLESSLNIWVTVLTAPLAWLIRTFLSSDRGGPRAIVVQVSLSIIFI